ncbi:MAG TPA: hypothetical protein VJG29_00890 [Candidatus Paceibacterota bacterium]
MSTDTPTSPQSEVKLGILPREALTDKEFEVMFGFKPKEPLQKEEREEAEQINQLFDAMQDELSLSSLTIFLNLYGEECGKELHSLFLRRVTTCPPAVRTFCQQSLAPDAARKAKDKNSEKVVEEDAEDSRVQRARALDFYLAKVESSLETNQVAEALELIRRVRTYIRVSTPPSSVR